MLKGFLEDAATLPGKQPGMMQAVCVALIAFAAPPPRCLPQMKTPNLALGERALYAGPIDCFRQIVRKEGVAGLYRGLRPNLIGVMPEKSLKLTVNDVCREAFTESNGPGGGLSLTRSSSPGGPDSISAASES
jgi:hypothetical protein